MHCFHLVTPPDRLQICLDVIFLLKQVMFIVKLDGPVIFLSRCIKTLQPAKAKSITPVGIPSFWGFTSFTWGLPQNEVNNKNKLLMNLNSIYKLLSISVSFLCLNSAIHIEVALWLFGVILCRATTTTNCLSNESHGRYSLACKNK